MSNTYTIAGVVVDGNTAYECKKKTYIVQGMSLDWSMVEQGNDVLKGMVKPYGFFKDAEFCQRCSEIYSSVQSKLITHNESQGLNASGEPLREKERGNVKIMRHNNFKGYLEDAKKIYEKARVEYERLQDEWDATQEEYNRIQRDGLTERGKVIARGQYMQYEDEYKQGMANLEQSVKTQLAEVRKAMKEHTDEFYRADPSKLDANTMALLNSGILTTDELIYLTEQNRSNVTMLRMIGVKAKENYDKLREKKGTLYADTNLAALQMELNRLGGGEEELGAFDAVTERIMSCIHKDNSYANAHVKTFETTFSGYYDLMDKMIAQPEVSAE
ncbi:MAG: hypothetical protein J6C12_04165 [Lachnospiraceae bacterium]|nr:hypothetical protein [Lachnospiraceae bacterium]